MKLTNQEITKIQQIKGRSENNDRNFHNSGKRTGYLPFRNVCNAG